MQVMMALVKLPTFSDHLSIAISYPAIADNMPCNRFKVLQQILHFVDDSAFSEGSQKVFKVSPVIEAVGNQCLKVESKTCDAVDEQIIPSKTNTQKFGSIIPRNPVNEDSETWYDLVDLVSCIIPIYTMVKRTDLLLITIIYPLVINLLIGYVLIC